MVSDLRGLSEKEASGAEFLQGYTENTALAPTETTFKYVAVAWGTFTIWLSTDSEIYFTWSTGATDVISTTNSLKIPANTTLPLRVPWGMVDRPRTNASLYFQVKRVLTGTADVRISEG